MSEYDILNRLTRIERDIKELRMGCEVCKEKQVEINRILTAYKKDKRLFYIVIGIQMALLIVITAMGKEGVVALLDVAMKKFL